MITKNLIYALKEMLLFYCTVFHYSPADLVFLGSYIKSIYLKGHGVGEKN